MTHVPFPVESALAARGATGAGLVRAGSAGAAGPGRSRSEQGVAPPVYLAGPDVFLPDAPARGEALKRICAAHGLLGIFPLDQLPGEPAEWAALPPAQAIARRNEAHIRRSRAVIANLTPFRGPSADVGTVYEVGFARALGLPVFGWSTDPRDYLARCAASEQDGVWRDAEGLQVEGFGLAENLMIACGVASLVCSAGGGRWTELSGFEACVLGVVEGART